MITIEKLNAFGADTAGGIARCAGSEALYLRLVKMIPADANFETLKNAIDTNDLDGAFAASHALKGVLGNLSLTPMYLKCDEITELLRQRTAADYAALYGELEEMKDQLSALCAD